MQTAYQYRLQPTNKQQCLMRCWLEMLCGQDNWRLADRFDGWEMNRCPVNAGRPVGARIDASP